MDLIKQATPWLPSIVIRDMPYINRNLIDFAAASAFTLPFTYLTQVVTCKKLKL